MPGFAELEVQCEVACLPQMLRIPLRSAPLCSAVPCAGLRLTSSGDTININPRDIARKLLLSGSNDDNNNDNNCKK